MYYDATLILYLGCVALPAMNEMYYIELTEVFILLHFYTIFFSSLLRCDKPHHTVHTTVNSVEYKECRQKCILLTGSIVPTIYGPYCKLSSRNLGE